MIIGIYSPNQGRDYVAIGITFESVVADLENQVNNYGDEVFINSEIIFYTATELKVKRTVVYSIE